MRLDEHGSQTQDKLGSSNNGGEWTLYLGKSLAAVSWMNVAWSQKPTPYLVQQTRSQKEFYVVYGF